MKERDDLKDTLQVLSKEYFRSMEMWSIYRRNAEKLEKRIIKIQNELLKLKENENENN